MPKKIRRSNNPLRKTNRKGRKTANRNRLRKFVGGARHWVAGARPGGGYFSNAHIVLTKDYIDLLSGPESGPGSSTLLYRLISTSFRDELKRLARDQMWRVLKAAEQEWQGGRALRVHLGYRNHWQLVPLETSGDRKIRRLGHRQ